MKRVAAIAVILSTLALAGCGMSLDDRTKLLRECSNVGGEYTENAFGFGRCEVPANERNENP